MSSCLVCGSDFPDDADICPKCETGVHILNDIRNVHQESRFLFGSAKSLKVSLTDTPEPPPIERPAQRRQPPKPKPRPPQTDPDQSDMIVNRDIPLYAPQVERPSRMSGVFLTDVFCCLIMNAIILTLIIWVSPRSFGEIMTFSLIPIMFVLLTFTILYYWLFMGLFQKTLGRIIIEKLINREKS